MEGPSQDVPFALTSAIDLPPEGARHAPVGRGLGPLAELPAPGYTGDVDREGLREARMIRTLEASVDEQGTVRLLEPVELPAARRALVTILDEEPREPANALALLSEAALAEDWNRPEEEAAWSHLQPAP